MTPSLSSCIRAFALSANSLLAHPQTPPALRARVSCCVSELRDALPEEAARRLAGLEAEAVIASYAAPDESLGAEFPVESHQKHHEQQAI